MSIKDTCVSVFEPVSTTISNSTSLSPAVNLGGLRLCAIVMPSVWTAANLTFQASYDGGTTWTNMYDASGNELTVTAAAARSIYLDPTIFAVVPYLKVRSGTSSTVVAQAQDSILQLVARSV